MLADKKRILVIGCPGAGKSTLSMALAKKLGLPLIHLDAIFWKPGWVQSEREEFRGKLEQAVSMPAWIIDGNYGSTLAMRLERSDAVIYLDFPRIKCIWGVLKRMMINIGKTRPDMAEGCPEKIDREFLKYVWEFNKNNSVKQKQLVADSSVLCITLKSRREVNKLLEEA